MLSSLYRKGPKPRTKDEVIAEAFLIPAMAFPVSLQEHAQRWADEAVLQLEEKTALLQRADFAHGYEDSLTGANERNNCARISAARQGER